MSFARLHRSGSTVLRFMAAWGPGLLVMLADTDVGNIVTAAQGGVVWGYRLLPVVLVLVPVLYTVQELTVRLGIATGMGFAELARHRYGAYWAWLLLVGLAVAVTGSLVTEFTGFAGVGEMFGVPREATLVLAALALLAVVFSGAYRRVERVALVIGLFELTFLLVAWVAHPEPALVVEQLHDLPVHNASFLYLCAALIGSAFNPWMVFYQQSAVADRGLGEADLPAARWDTGFGALLTQLLTAAILIAAAATLGAARSDTPLGSVGDISAALEPILGPQTARLAFGLGILGAAMVAAIVASLAMAWSVGEVLGVQRGLAQRALRQPRFVAVYAACVLVSAALVWLVPDLVWLNVATQVVNALMLPLMGGLLLLMAWRVLPQRLRPGRGYLWWYLLALTSLSAAGWWGAWAVL